MNTRTILKIMSTIIGTLSATSCNTESLDTSTLPIVNNVQEIQDEIGVSIPLNDSIFIVTGKVTHSIFLLGEGILILEDNTNSDSKIYLRAKNKYKKGTKVTIPIKKKELVNVDGKSYAIYFEQ